MNQFLLDTNICIFYMKGLYSLNNKFLQIGPENCFISEITLAELMFGVENSERKEQNQIALDNFLSGIKLIPIFHSLGLYAREKARLRKSGTPVDDFDLLIGCTAVTQNLTLITNNSNHFNRIQSIRIEDWTK